MVLPPPSYPAGMLLLGVLLQRWHPVLLPRDRVSMTTAALSTIAAAFLLHGSWRAFRTARTPLEPWKATRALVRDGVFRLSRNPVYLAFLLIQAAIAWWVGNGWLLGLLPVTWSLLDRLQVRREETYLLSQFGDDYRDYCRRVRRWI
jgi:protein-S-isoprenylcysteine O-methyltransferase Ste14